MKTPFDSATRWKKQILDTLRRELAELLRVQEGLELQIANWDSQLVAEQGLMAEEPLLNYAAFATRARTERTALEARMVELDIEVSRLQARIAEAFQDFKSLDVAGERHRGAARARQAATEALEMDELALQRHIRAVANNA